MYASVLLVAFDISATVPLVPSLAHRFALSPFWSAALLALPSATVMLISLPLGAMSDRFGARRLTSAAVGFLLISYLLQAVPTLPTIAAGRLLCGLSFALVWSAALSWLGELHHALGRPGSHLGATVTAGAAGTAIGPVLAGVLAEAFGLPVPFLIGGLATTAVIAGLALAGTVTATAAPPPPAEQESFQPTGRSRRPATWEAAGSLAMSGVAGGVVQLLAPLQLSAIGESPSQIGTSLSVASAVYIASSALVVGRKQAAVTRRVNAAAALVLALCLVPALAGDNPLAVEAVLVLTAVPRAAIGTLAYPLAASEVATAQRTRVFARLNTMWAAAMLAAPLAAGAGVQHLGIGWTYAGTTAVLLAVGLQLTVRVLRSDRNRGGGCASPGEPATYTRYQTRRT